MHVITFKHEHNIGDKVFHATPDGDKGIIINFMYDHKMECVKYNVVFGRTAEDDVWCFEEELSNSKVF